MEFPIITIISLLFGVFVILIIKLISLLFGAIFLDDTIFIVAMMAYFYMTIQLQMKGSKLK